MWPFGRRGGKAARLKHAGHARRSSKDLVPPASAPTTTTSPTHGAGVKKTPSRRSSRRKRKMSPLSLRDVEKEKEKAFADVHLDKEKLPGVARRSTSLDNEDITALPFSKRLEHSPHLRPVTNDHGIPYNFHNNSLSPSQSSLPRERRRLHRPQSLRTTDPTSSVPRRKSTKRKAHDSLREEEIRAMSMPLPQKRPAGNSQGMLRRDSKKVKGGLNWHFERPTSNISLPQQDSIHSSMSSSSESRAFRVSTFDMFAPRPKIRCTMGSQYYYTEARTSPIEQIRRSLEKEKENTRETTATSKGRKRRTSRIDDLADTLDAGALREILEKDKRRKERKAKADEERLKRKLERRAEKQRAAEQYAAAERSGTPPVPLEMSRGAVGLGIERGPPTPMEDVRLSTPPPSQPKAQHLEPIATTPKTQQNSQLPTPMDSPVEEAMVADARAVRLSRASVSPSPQGHARGPSNISEMPALLSEIMAQDSRMDSTDHGLDPKASGSLHPVETVDTTATSKRGSSRRASSEGGRISVFTSFFKRGKRGSRDQGRLSPSEVSFSNTSRESMSRQPIPAHLVAPPPLQPVVVKRPSSVPRRTMSKFKEDLPEYPLSPPDSRMQSPEVASSAIATRRRSQPLSELRVSSNSPGAETQDDSPVSPGVPATGVMSQSLASVDSEGSWLSGRPMKRQSNKSHIRSSVGSSSVAKRNESFNNSYEELGIPDDEYFKRLTPRPDEQRSSGTSGDYILRKASSTAMAMETPADVEDEEILPTVESSSTDDELVKETVVRTPTVVHRQARVKSTEGLMAFYQAEADNPSPEEKTSNRTSDEVAELDSPTSDGEAPVLQRAQSVDLGKRHSRQLSAGSAKLLDIPARRASVDPKRSSLNSQHTLSQQ